MMINESAAMDILDNFENPLFRSFWHGEPETVAAVIEALGGDDGKMEGQLCNVQSAVRDF